MCMCVRVISPRQYSHKVAWCRGMKEGLNIADLFLERLMVLPPTDTQNLQYLHLPIGGWGGVVSPIISPTQSNPNPNLHLQYLHLPMGGWGRQYFYFLLCDINSDKQRDLSQLLCF